MKNKYGHTMKATLAILHADCGHATHPLTVRAWNVKGESICEACLVKIEKAGKK